MGSYYNHLYIWYLPYESAHKKYTSYDFKGWDRIRGTIDLGIYREFLSDAGIELSSNDIIQNYELENLANFIKARYHKNEPAVRQDAKRYGYAEHDFKSFVHLVQEYWNAGALLEKWC